MVTRPLTQRLYDKSKADLRDFRNDMADWHVNQAASGFAFSGTAVDLFWQQSQKYLELKIAEYFEWIEKESAGIMPACLRQEAIEQCVGAVASFGRSVRDMTIKKNKIFQKLKEEADHGLWLGVDDNSIRDRGTRLISALGLGSSAPISAKLNHFVSGQKWLPLMLSIIALFVSLANCIRK
jgi:hypothetical protein